uniref:Uncharacterized protein n=1 Tax=Romanomermis culicivorax TaxID=13658 RepID=A0A915KY73_ROMCU
MPKVSHTRPDFTRLLSQSSSRNATTATRCALSFDQMLLPQRTNIAQSSAVPTARDALDQLSTATAHITNNALTVQTIDQIIGAVSDQFQAQKLRVQREIREQTKATNVRFAALAEQMQQLILTTNTRNPPTPRPPPVKPKAPSMDTLYNNKFSRTARGEEDLPPPTPQRHQPPVANNFGFSDYPPDDYYDHRQPRYELPSTSHCEEDSRIKTIVYNMHLLIIDGAATNKCLLCFFIRLENEFG